jgi:hypothetical protein
MRLVKVGGTVMIATTANNYLGHGFYQFSPEWGYRTFSRRWGFEILSCYLVECDKRYELVPAVDPEVAGKRIETFTTRVPTYLMIAAKNRAEASNRLASAERLCESMAGGSNGRFSEKGHFAANRAR